jgi:hypothetical protein
MCGAHVNRLLIVRERLDNFSTPNALAASQTA